MVGALSCIGAFSCGSSQAIGTAKPCSDYCHKLVEQMEKNLCNLSEHLREASSLMSTFLDRGQLCCPNSSNGGNQSVINSTSASSAQPEHSVRFSEVQSKAQPRSSGTGLSAASIGNRIGSAVAHARSMITSSAFTGVYSRLSQRERLRASTSAAVVNQPPKKKERKRIPPTVCQKRHPNLF